MATVTSSVSETCARAKQASRALGMTSSAQRNAALEAMASLLEARQDEIVQANDLDLEAGRENGLSPALMDRLTLSPARIRAMADGTREIASLADPVGEVIDGWRLPNGVQARKVRVPLGVVAVVYEARPNVTIDCAALCLKSGNAIVLRGSSSAEHSNAVLAAIAEEAALAGGLPEASVSIVAGGGRDELRELATQNGLIDLIIPRGGEGLKAALKGVATVPVIFAASGNCHVYVDRSADLAMAREILLNAKLQRPGVCNAAETLLVHSEVAGAFLPAILDELLEAGVVIHADERTIATAGPGAGERLRAATPEDWDTEYLDLEIAVAVLDSAQAAVDHINRHGSGHSEAIITGELASAQLFTAGVDAACVYVNASTRFTDGGQFGMGAEIGNSTQKLHARGPIGLRELCTSKYVMEGSGQIRA